jgi:hypothetical protein
MHTDDMDADSGAASQAWAGLPQTAYSALTPSGEIEQATKIAAGFKQPRHGWRRAVVVIGLVVLAFGVVAVIVAGLLGAAQQ